MYSCRVCKQVARQALFKNADTSSSFMSVLDQHDFFP
jgi:hypothetical protein